MATTKVKSFLKGNQIKSYSMDSKTTKTTLDMLGIGAVDDSVFKDVVDLASRYPHAYGLDAAPATITTPSVPNAIQFLQHWLAPMVEIVTWARVSDRLMGRANAGAWHQEEIVQPVLERVGQSRPYSDVSDTNLANWNMNFGRRTIVRQEADVWSGVLSAMRAAEMRVDDIGTKRSAAALALEITRNAIAFYGYNAGYGTTYGLLNDPNLLAYTTVPAGAGGDTEWSTKTFTEIVDDLKTAASTLRTQSGSNIDPNTARIKVGVASSVIDMLNTTTNLGLSVWQWIKQTYPNWEFIAVPEFDGANGGENVAYFIAEDLVGQDVGTQYVPDLLRMIGAQPQAKGFLEVYSNATAGYILKQPTAIARISGI